MAKPPKIDITMTWREVHMAGGIAVTRTVYGMSKRKNRYGLECSGIGADIDWMGCLSEMAVAKWRNCFWNSEDVGAIDVGNVEVRAIDNDNNRLILHAEDRDAVPFVSVLVVRELLPVVSLRGWVYGWEGKVAEFWQDPTGKDRWAFFVSNDFLHPMEALPT
jgi:hypothetical protein